MFQVAQENGDYERAGFIVTSFTEANTATVEDSSQGLSTSATAAIAVTTIIFVLLSAVVVAIFIL